MPPIDPQSTALSRDSRRRLSRKSKVRQCLEMQESLYCVVRDQDAKPLERASCARSWDVLEERIRILRNRVKPGSRNVSVSEQPEKKRRPGARSIDPALTPEQVASEMKIA